MVRDVGPLIGAIDQGTSSSRFLVFTANSGELITDHHIEIKKICIKDGWVEQDPKEILNTVIETINKVITQLIELDFDPKAIKGIGLCNQRETTIIWDKVTGEPVYNAILWLDNRTCDIVDHILDSIPNRDKNFFKHKTGLPISTYFSAFKLKWLIKNVPEVKEKIKSKTLLFGNVDSWLLWKLTGNHLTDVSNASRTFLMDIESLKWDEHLCKFFRIPMNILPKILSTADNFGNLLDGPLKGVPITAVVGDQSAALVGQHCLELGRTKATYGTGCFILQNIGSGSISNVIKEVSKEARNTLITTVAYKLGQHPVVYALEGSIAIAGAAIDWLKYNINLINSVDDIELLARKVHDSSGVFFVPAFQGLYAPYWDANASGMMIGLSQFTKPAHIIRATLESIAYQTADILSIMRRSDEGLAVDGGMSCNDIVCQILADINGVNVIRPSMIETSALGAAILAGHTLGFWDLHRSHNPFSNEDNISGGKQRSNSFFDDSVHKSGKNGYSEYPKGSDVFKPMIDEMERIELQNAWRLAVERSRRWKRVKKIEQKRINYRRRSSLPIGLFIISSFAIFLISKHFK